MFTYEDFTQKSRPFVEWMLEWYNALPTLPLATVLDGHPERVGVASIDLIKGFTSTGVLASPRIAQTCQPTADLFRALHQNGVCDFVLLQDSHPSDAVEFAQYGTHCLIGSEEAETIDAFTELPFFEQMTIIPKNSVNPAMNTSWEEWLNAHSHLRTFITVGDCSDICTYQLAMDLRTRFNAEQIHGIRVIAPVNTIDTYDLPVATAQQIGAVPHDGDFLHVVFLYHMMLNGVEVVKGIRY